MYFSMFNDYMVVINLDKNDFSIISGVSKILRKLPYSEYITSIKKYAISYKRIDDFIKEITIESNGKAFFIFSEFVSKKYFQYLNFYDVQKNIKSKTLLNVVLGEYNKYSKLPLMPYQTMGAHFAYRAKRVLIADSVGLGKSQALSEPILVEDGWKRMGNLTVDDKVYGRDGILYNINGLFLQGIIDMYRITFTDGSTCTSSLDHLWKVKHAYNGERDGWKIRSLSEMLEIGINYDIKKGSGTRPNKWRVQAIRQIKFKKRNLLIDPYVLGVLIGDGYLCGSRVAWSTPDFDFDIVTRMKKILNDDYIITVSDSGTCPQYGITRKDRTKHRNPMITKIHILGLDVKSGKKFIPSIYKISSIKQRLNLLRGLMDTDGSASNNRITYFTTSKRLANDVVDLVRSLGGISNIRSYKCDRSISTDYQVNVKLNICPFYSERKSKGWHKTRKNYTSRFIKDVTYIGKRHAQCISVDSPDSMYVCGNYIPTHNTPQSIIAAEKMIVKEEIFNTVVVVPSSLKRKWAKDIVKFIGEDRYVLVDGDKNTRVEQYEHGLKKHGAFIIMNYDLAIRDWDRILFPLMDDDYRRCVIFDEIQYAKNITAKRTKKAVELAEKCDSVIGLSATFFETSIMDVFSIMNVIDPTTLGSRYWNFFNKYVIADYWGKEIGHKDITDVIHALEPVKIRRQKENVLKQLPNRSEIIYWCKLTEDQGMCYDDILNNISVKIKNDKRAAQVTTAEILAQIQMLIQSCLSTELLDYDVTSSSKLTLLYEILEQIGKEKIVIFVRYVKMVEIIERELKKRGYKVKFIHGKSVKNVSEKQDVVDNFNNTNEHQILVTSDVLKEGVDLVGASVLIHFDLLWNPAVMEQRAGRLDRIGQKNNVTIIYIVSENTIEQKMYERLKERKDLSSLIVDNGFISSRVTVKELMYMAGV